MIGRGGKPLVYLISDGSITNKDLKSRSARLMQLVESAVSYRIPMVQIREKHLTAKNLFDLSVKAVRATRGSNTRLLVNDRLDIALAAGADGVHLTSNSVKAAIVRRFVPEGFLIGVSTHSVDEVLAENSSGADFVVFGPVFDSPGKASGLGLNSLKGAVGVASKVDVLALGGIDRTNYVDVLETGADGFAAIRFLNDRSKLEEISTALGL